MLLPQASIPLTWIAPLVSETWLMALPDLDGSNQFRLAEMHGILNAKALAHLPDFSDGNHSVIRAHRNALLFFEPWLRLYIHNASNSSSGCGCHSIPHSSTPSLPYAAG